MIAFFKLLFKKFHKFHPVLQVLTTLTLLYIIRKLYNTFLYSYFNGFNLEGFGTPKELVYFYMDGCGHCKTFSPIWDQFASGYSGNLNVRKVERAAAGNDIDKYEIQGFPSVLLLDGQGGKKEFSDDRNIQNLEAFAK
jgi:thiol-disulfide isomerase/thioredoxin